MNSPPSEYVELDHFFAFVGFQHATGHELWVSDGTGPGTRLVVDLYPGSRGARIQGLVEFDGRAFFAADDGVRGRELWASDGTAAGTVLVADVAAGEDSSDPSDLFVWNGRLFFLAQTTAVGRELFVSDGTTAGLVADIRPGGSWAFHSPMFPPTAPVFAGLGDSVYFAAEDGSLGRELWRSDGTPGGTVLIRNIHLLASSNPFGFAALGGRMLFVATDHNGVSLWGTDGTPAGTWPVRSIPGTVVSALQPLHGDEALFWVDDGSNASHLWKTDGATGLTSRVATINASNVEWTTPIFGKPGESRLLFNANDGIHGNEPWVSDGTAAGTAVLVDVAPIHSDPRDFVRAGNRVVFVADDNLVGHELHAVDLVDTGDYAVEKYGSGCPGSSGAVPEIAVRGEVRASAAGPFEVELARARPLAATAWLVGIERASIALPAGCTIWTTPLAAVPGTTSGTGAASVAIRPFPALAGLVFHGQFVTLDPGGALLGQLSSTSGIEIVGGL